MDEFAQTLSTLGEDALRAFMFQECVGLVKWLLFWGAVVWGIGKGAKVIIEIAKAPVPDEAALEALRASKIDVGTERVSSVYYNPETGGVERRP